VLKNTIEFEVEKQKRKGLPLHKVEVTTHGKIDGSCNGKNEWDNAMWGPAPRILWLLLKWVNKTLWTWLSSIINLIIYLNISTMS
jgi:hypothetical protein